MTGQIVRFGKDEAFSGYLALPADGVGPGALVLHAWWGLNDFFKTLCDRLAAQGYVAFAPDLYGGSVAQTVDEAAALRDANEDAIQEKVLEATRYLTRHPAARPIGIGVIGFSMGAAWAIMLSTLRPATTRAVALFYGAYTPDLSKARASYIGHFSETDEWEPMEGVRELEQTLRDGGRDATFHIYPGVGHWFFEEDRPDAFNPAAAQLAWERTLAFLAEKLPDKDEPLPRDRDELLERIEQGWGEIQAAIAGRSEEELTRPGPEGWSAREHVAHIAFWERMMLLSHVRGAPATEVAQTDEATLKSFDGINAVAAQRVAGRSFAEVQAEAREIHEAVVAEFKTRPYESLMAPRFAEDPDERPLMIWIAGDSYGHYGEHAGYIRGILNR